jgi:hypothetical protein
MVVLLCFPEITALIFHGPELPPTAKNGVL